MNTKSRAYYSISHSKADKQQDLLILMYRQWGPMSDRQMAGRTGIERSTINARRNELVSKGAIVEWDKQRDEQTHVMVQRYGLAEDRQNQVAFAAKEAVMAVMEKSRLANQPTSSVQQGGFDF